MLQVPLYSHKNIILRKLEVKMLQRFEKYVYFCSLAYSIMFFTSTYYQTIPKQFADIS